MKKYYYVCLSAFLLILPSFASAGSYFFVTAKEGLFIRQSPSLAAKKVGKLPYGFVITADKPSKNGWQKIAYHDYPYLVSFSKPHTTMYASKGYVHNDYLVSLDEKKHRVSEISKRKFEQLHQTVRMKRNRFKTIKIFHVISRLLQNKAEFEKIDDQLYQLKRLTTDSGVTHVFNTQYDDTFLKAYYPELGILLFEGGHSSDVSINIRTGELTETTGNPVYIVESPNKRYRLNGFFPGQECSVYFFQKKVKGVYTYFSSVNGGFYKHDDTCTMNQFTWITDTSFIYSHDHYAEGQEVPTQKYYFGEIKSE